MAGRCALLVAGLASSARGFVTTGGSPALSSAMMMRPQARSVLRLGETSSSSSSSSEAQTVEVLPEAGTAEASPPQTMAQCITQALAATVAAINDGQQLLEVEFPPVAADVLEAPDTSAYDIARANTELAIRYAAALYQRTEKKVAIMYPDVAELERAIEDRGSADPAAGVSLHSLRKPFVLAEVGDALSAIFAGQNKKMIRPVADADAYVCLTFSAQELPDVEALCELDDYKKPVVLFNLKLDTQRGDLGLPAFPSKDLQWRFLSRALPVYYLRTRQYSTSTPRPPFVVNYQGAIFRVYPGQYQSLLDTGKRYRAVDVRDRRPALGEFKALLTKALKIGAGPNDKVATFARTGVKSITWWEEDKDNQELQDTWRR